ncbi:response regulator transcription factor [Pontitalea aquivivens]|uniref:response regulator transcription factor n=1 Tax=Pontitalea aquivivens TaxID=3388663 RepID=UPI003970A740
MRVALIEDHESLARGIENTLRDQGYAVDWLADGLAGAQFLKSAGADVAIIDINLPGMNGLDLVREIRARGDSLPILILTAQGKTSDRVKGLDAGADDYLVKPFETAELLARIRALSRRRPGLSQPAETVGRLVYDRAARTLTGPDGPIDLPRRERALFECLLEAKGRIIDKDRLADSLYGTGAEVDTNAVELLISRLRRKLDGSGAAIRTARGLGYMLHDDSA